jgi:hypothetical protein
MITTFPASKNSLKKESTELQASTKDRAANHHHDGHYEINLEDLKSGDPF